MRDCCARIRAKIRRVAHLTRRPQLFPAGAFFEAQVAANPPAFAANALLLRYGGRDAAHAKIVLSTGVTVQRLSRGLCVRLFGGAGNIHADRAWSAFLSCPMCSRPQSETRPSFSSSAWITRHLSCRLGRKSRSGDRLSSSSQKNFSVSFAVGAVGSIG